MARQEQSMNETFSMLFSIRSDFEDIILDSDKESFFLM